MDKTYISPEGNPEIWQAGTQPEDYLTEEEWEAAHAPTLSALKALKVSEIMEQFSAKFTPITSIYPPEEQSSWPEQEADAARYMVWAEGGKQGPEPELTLLPQILLPGESIEELCASVLAKGQLFKALRNILQAQQRAHYHAVMNMTDPAEVQAYDVTYTLPAELAAYLSGAQNA